MSLVALPKAQPQGVPRDGLTRPLVVPKRGGQGFAHTRTSTFADAIEDKSGLTDWKLRQVVLGLARKPQLLNEVPDIDPATKEGKGRLNEIAATALDISGAHEKAEQGTLLHHFSELVDDNLALPPGATEQDRSDIAAYVLATLGFDVKHKEGFVVCNKLATGGSFDRINGYSGPGPLGEPISGNFIGDLKTGRIDYGQIKFAVQFAIYAKSEFYDHTRFPIEGYDPDAPLADRRKVIAAWKKIKWTYAQAKAAYTPLPNTSTEWGVLIHLPAGESRCDLYWVDLNAGWKLALLAQKIRQARSKKTPFIAWAQETSEPDLSASA